MGLNLSGLKNNNMGKLNAGAAKKRSALSYISNHTTESAHNSILIPLKHVSVSLFLVSDHYRRTIIRVLFFLCVIFLITGSMIHVF